MNSVQISLLVAGLAMSGNGEEPKRSLSDAVVTFNARAARNPVGRTQPPLTIAAVCATVLWNLRDHDPLPVTDTTVADLRRLVDKGIMPSDFSFEFLTHFRPGDDREYTKWSVRLLVPWRQRSGIESGTTAIMIANTFVDVYEFGPAEKALLRQWGDGRVGSFERDRRAKERAKARAADKAHAANRDSESNRDMSDANPEPFVTDPRCAANRHVLVKMPLSHVGSPVIRC